MRRYRYQLRYAPAARARAYRGSQRRGGQREAICRVPMRVCCLYRLISQCNSSSYKNMMAEREGWRRRMDASTTIEIDGIGTSGIPCGTEPVSPSQPRVCSDRAALPSRWETGRRTLPPHTRMPVAVPKLAHGRHSLFLRHFPTSPVLGPKVSSPTRI